ncbi:DoxX family protein [Adhaeribacter rhizoryzae]|uniref:DoxX family protein n=1 Tax=Adhaeribacter rhizoryzae TaxID=2607907 RepID=A0A5M6D7D7_9BACT|nr:DoxX family protein [Adhaeribacter rhizoryzae]KAA5543464.1 DoxX family protein [Adhaeribacter rhizoryzae]
MNAPSTDTGKLLLRLTIGGLLLLHGISKLIKGIDGLVELHEAKGIPAVMAYGVYLGEVIAPLLLIIGLRARLAALLIAFTMFWAIVMRHFSDIFKLTESGAWGVELPALFLFGALAVYFLGAGRYALSVRSSWD